MYRHTETNEIWTYEELIYHFDWFEGESEYMSQFDSVDDWINDMLTSDILVEV